MKICPVAAELFHADRWSDMTKLMVAFRNFANMPKTDGSLWCPNIQNNSKFLTRIKMTTYIFHP
jgi:hypothetical protein